MLSENCAVSFSIEQIRDDDKLISFYTEFRSYSVFLTVLNFLGPAIDKSARRHHSTKVSPKNKLLITLMRLHINLKILNLLFIMEFHTLLCQDM